MEEKEKHIELYPGHWLYNAGVIGFLSVLDRCNLNADDLLFDDGTIKGNISSVFNNKRNHKGFEVPEIICHWFIASGQSLKNDFDSNGDDPIKDIWGTLFNVIYRGFFNANSNLLYTPSKTSPAVFNSFLNFVTPLFEYEDRNPTCSFCMKKGRQTYKNRFSSEHFKELGGSDGNQGMPNSFWNNQKSIGGAELCDTCSFLLLNKHLSFTSLSDRTKVFINAHSFRLMYELNKLVNGSFEWSRNNNKSLLAMSVIEYCAKANATIGLWAGMNIEIVAVNNDTIDFYSLPSNVTKLISNKRVATLLSEIGEFKILNLVLDQKYNELVEMAYRILRISMKNETNEGDRKFINDSIFLSRNKFPATAQRLFANKILKLYALIEEHLNTN
jgi:CRISPR-associated protein Cst1